MGEGEAGVAFGDAHEFVVLGDSFGAGEGAGLDLAGAEANGEVSDGGVFGFAGAVRDDGAVAGAFCQVDSGDGLGESADLVRLDEDGVGDAGFDAALEELFVSDEEIVADELSAVAEAIGHGFPAVPVVFGEAVLDRDYGIII